MIPINEMTVSVSQSDKRRPEQFTFSSDLFSVHCFCADPQSLITQWASVHSSEELPVLHLYSWACARGLKPSLSVPSQGWRFWRTIGLLVLAVFHRLGTYLGLPPTYGTGENDHTTTRR